MVWKNALRVGMPLWARGGDAAQLGGEFVLGPGRAQCAFAHRMQHARGHAPVLDVLAAAGAHVSSSMAAAAQTLRRGRVPARVHLPPLCAVEDGQSETSGSEREAGVEKAKAQGEGALNAAVALSKGEAVDQTVWVPFELVTPANVAEYLAKN